MDMGADTDDTMIITSDYSHDGTISSMDDSSEDDRILLASDLASLIKRHNVPHAFVDDLLRTLLPFHPHLPRCCRTLLQSG